MWYAIKHIETGLYVPMLMHFCTKQRWFWTRADAQDECDRLNNGRAS